MAYFGLIAFLVNMDDWTTFDGYFNIKHSHYLDVFEKKDAKTLVPLTQKLIKQYFKTE